METQLSPYLSDEKFLYERAVERNELVSSLVINGKECTMEYIKRAIEYFEHERERHRLKAKRTYVPHPRPVKEKTPTTPKRRGRPPKSKTPNAPADGV